MEEINIIKQNYLYRKDIHRLIGKRRDINDYILKNKTANYLIKNIFDDKPCKFRFIGSPIPLATDQCFRL